MELYWEVLDDGVFVREPDFCDGFLQFSFQPLHLIISWVDPCPSFQADAKRTKSDSVGSNADWPVSPLREVNLPCRFPFYCPRPSQAN